MECLGWNRSIPPPFVELDPVHIAWSEENRLDTQCTALIALGAGDERELRLNHVEKDGAKVPSLPRTCRVARLVFQASSIRAVLWCSDGFFGS